MKYKLFIYGCLKIPAAPDTTTSEMDNPGDNPQLVFKRIQVPRQEMRRQIKKRALYKQTTIIKRFLSVNSLRKHETGHNFCLISCLC